MSGLLRHVDAMNSVLASWLGADKSTAAPASFDVCLYTDDPDNGGVELDAVGGYATQTVANDGTTWPDAPADGSVTSAAVDFGTSTDAWSDVASWWVAKVGGNVWMAMPLADEIDVSATGQPVSVTLTAFYDEVD